MTPRESNYKYTFNSEIIDINYFSVLTKLNVMFYIGPLLVLYLVC